MRILLVEDDPDLSRQLKLALGDAGYAVDHAGDGEEAQFLGETEPYDAVILDLGLPKVDGVSVLERWRRGNVATPVLILTARAAWSDKVAGFDAGADDYLTKPFGVPELLARIRAMLRRTAMATGDATPQGRFQTGELTLDFSTRRVSVGTRDVRLTPTEYRLLSLMAQHAGKVLTHMFLLKQVWGPEHSSEVNYLRVFMAGLRRKLEDDSTQPRYLLTEQGVGYRLADA